MRFDVRSNIWSQLRYFEIWLNNWSWSHSCVVMCSQYHNFLWLYGLKALFNFDNIADGGIHVATIIDCTGWIFITNVISVVHTIPRHKYFSIYDLWYCPGWTDPLVNILGLAQMATIWQNFLLHFLVWILIYFIHISLKCSRLIEASDMFRVKIMWPLMLLSRFELNRRRCQPLKAGLLYMRDSRITIIEPAYSLGLHYWAINRHRAGWLIV